MKSNHSFSEIVLTCASILLCFTIVSSYLTAGMFARFVSSDTVSDSARVATFNVSETGTLVGYFAAELIPDVPCVRDIVVKNNSEVAISYTITIRNESNNMDMSFRFGTEGDMQDMNPSADGYTCTSYLGALSEGQNYKLEITWNSKGPEIDLEYMGCVDLIKVTLIATQVD